MLVEFFNRQGAKLAKDLRCDKRTLLGVLGVLR